MIEKDDISYGVVPLFKDVGEYKVLLVHQISYRGDSFWIFPKGHLELGESPAQTALRELAEETGVVEVSIVPEAIFNVAYSFVHENVRINKKVQYYLGICQTSETHISQPYEIKALRWCTFPEAQQLLTHKNSQDVLDQVVDFLESI